MIRFVYLFDPNVSPEIRKRKRKKERMELLSTRLIVGRMNAQRSFGKSSLKYDFVYARMKEFCFFNYFTNEYRSLFLALLITKRKYFEWNFM